MPNFYDALNALGIESSSIAEIQSPDRHIFATFSVRRDGQELWHKLRATLPDIGYWPVIVGNGRNIADRLRAAREPSNGVDAILERAAKINIAAWIDDWHRDRLKDLAETIEGEELDDLWECSIADMLENATPKTKFHTARESSNAANFLLVPTPIASHVPAYLCYGGWNDCPDPEVHVAFHSYWQRKYGSEIAIIADDVIETFLNRPLTDRVAALALAKEQYAYCYDIVEQGTETIPVLASELMKSQYWFFWWD